MQTQPLFLPHAELNRLFGILKADGYRLVGPMIQDDVIVYDNMDRSEQLPWGVHDVQRAGSYRLEASGGRGRAFDWANGPQGIKPHLFKSHESLWRVQRDANGKLAFQAVQPVSEKLALFGVKPCDVRGLAIQDKVLAAGAHADPRYVARRNGLVLIAVNCTRASANCFCVAANGDPSADGIADLAMTEIDGGFVVTFGSVLGEKFVADLPLGYATSEQLDMANFGVDQARKSQTKTLPSGDFPSRLMASLDHPQWERVAEQCLSCGNCTQVCPTCFCHSEHDESPLGGDASEHVREWDSCFNAGHADIVGSHIRDDIRKRYRQWLTHKFATWYEQFGTSGCVGCGRCIAWCPAGIDVTQQLHALVGAEVTQ